MVNRKTTRVILAYILIFFQSSTFSAGNAGDNTKKLEADTQEKQSVSTAIQFSDIEKMLRTEPIQRGSIYSRHGILLAESKLLTEVVMLPKRVLCPVITSRKQCVQKLLKDIQLILSLSKKEFRRAQLKINGRGHKIVLIQSTKIKDNLTGLKDFAKQYKGVYITSRYQRHYYYPKYFAHVVGYVTSLPTVKSTDKELNFYLSKLLRKQIGKTGLEKYYDLSLTGGAHQSSKEDSETPFIGIPSKAKNITISIDLKTQKRAYQLLNKRQGTIVAFDPTNGEVLTLLSFPGFNSNYQALKSDPRVKVKPRRFRKHSLFTRFKSGRYPPGSTIKPIYALAGLHHKLIGLTDRLRCTGVFKLKGVERVWNDWAIHGNVRFSSAIAKSCNVYFYGLSQKLRIDRMTKILEKFNIGLRTGIDLPNEYAGIRPSREYKKRLYQKKYPVKFKNKPAIAHWFRGDSLAVGIGQGYLTVTPLQLATMVSMIATRGKYFIPRLLLSTEEIGLTQREISKPIQLKRGDEIDMKHWQSVIKAMTGVVHRYKTGTAFKSARYITGRYKVAGKTGTAQVVSLAQEKQAKEEGEKLPWSQRDHSLFIGFAPAKKPQIAVAVIVDHGGHGSDAAAPAAVRLINYYLMSVSTNKPTPKYRKAKRKIKKKTKKSTKNTTQKTIKTIPNKTPKVQSLKKI